MAAPAGFHGKVPRKGDFVTHRLPAGFVEPFDRWLQAGLEASRHTLGARWLDTYLVAPVWHFVLSAGVCGGAPAIGLWMPSVDRVGRYFPLVLAATMPDCLFPAAVAGSARGWSGRLEALALQSLEDRFDLKALDDGLEALGPPPYRTAAQQAEDGASVRAESRHGGLVATLGPSGDPAHGYADLLHHVFDAGQMGYSLWWSGGSEGVAPALLASLGLPPTDAFAALLDGLWPAHGWGGEMPLAAARLAVPPAYPGAPPGAPSGTPA